MSRNLCHCDPVIINNVGSTDGKSKCLEVATTNKNKLREIQKLTEGYYALIPRDLKLDEVQSTACALCH